MIRSFALTTAFLAATIARAAPLAALPGGVERDLGSLGRFATWAKVEVVLRGPEAQGRGRPNPFAITVDGVFTSPAGRSFRVPGFYDGDGKGGMDGNVWKLRFSADATGRWTFASASPDARLDGFTGSFDVTAPSEEAPDFHRWGRLEHAGTASDPADARSKPGSGGQLMALVPGLDLVVTRQTGSSGEWQYEEYLRRACAAVVEKEP